MSVRIRVDTQDKKIKFLEKRLLRVAKDAVKKVSRLIPLKNIEIVISFDPAGAVKEAGGVGGYTPDARHVLISLDPSVPTFKWKLDASLAGTIAHELHHAVRWLDPGYGDTLLEALVTEGLADHFVKEVFPRAKPFPWTNALDKKEIQMLMRRAKPLLLRAYDHDAWFFGSAKKRIPRWTGYTLGYKIVQDYLRRNTKIKPSDVVHVEAKRFL